jgi:hypothetical protein
MCVREMGKINRKEKVIKESLNVAKYWEMDEMNILGNALKQQSIEKGNSWQNKLKQELEDWVLGGGGGDLEKQIRE